MAGYFKSIDNLAVATYEQLLEAPEVGEKIAQSVVNFFNERTNQQEIDRLKVAGLQMESTQKESEKVSIILGDKSFVISGTFENFERDQLKEIIVANGGRVLSGVSSKLDYLLAGENMGPAKLEKAEKLGVKIIDIKEFEATLKG